MMGELKQIKISSLKSLIIASGTHTENFYKALVGAPIIRF